MPSRLILTALYLNVFEKLWVLLVLASTLARLHRGHRCRRQIGRYVCVAGWLVAAPPPFIYSNRCGGGPWFLLWCACT